MDIRLPGGHGIEATRRIVEALPETRVIMLTSYAEDELLLEAIEAGASGYVLKQIGSDELVTAIERVARGEALIDPSMTPKLLRHLRAARRSAMASAFKDLTEQELRVLALIAEGKTNREIAQTLFLSEGTVRNYVSSILSKLGLSNRAEAAAYAVEHNIRAYLDTEGGGS